MKWLIFIFLLFYCIVGNAQPNWKDSTIAKKYKPIETFELNNLVYFKTKSGWGVYSPEKAVLLVKPAFQFVLGLPNQNNTSFYAVKKGKIIKLDENGKQIVTQPLSQIGNGTEFGNSVSISNGIYSVKEETATVSRKYAQLSRHTEYSLTVNNNLLFMNAFEREQEPVPIKVFLNKMKETVDSVDANHNTVYEYFLPVAYSGVYNLKTGLWVVAPFNGKTGFCNGNILSLENTLVNNSINRTVSVFDAAGQKKGAGSLNDALFKTDFVKTILSGYNVQAVIATSKPNDLFKQWYVFDNGNKQGLYDALNFNVIIQPDKYEFIHVPYAYDQTIFTIENSKVGMLNLAEKNKDYSNLYDELSRVNYYTYQKERWYDLVLCNNDAFEPSSQIDTGQVNVFLASQRRGFKSNASVKIEKDKIVVNDYIAKGLDLNEPIVIVDVEGNVRDSVVYVGVGPYTARVKNKSGKLVDTVLYDYYDPKVVYMQPSPCESYSGVYNLSTKKWIVPQKFSRISINEFGFSCVLQKNDSVKYSFFTTEGKLIFSSLTVDSLINNNDFFNKFSGTKFSTKAKLKKLSGVAYIYDGLPVVVNDAKKSGVFDLFNLEWIVKPEFDLVDQSELLSSYFVVKENKIGLTDIFGNLIAAPYFKKIAYNYIDPGFILDDSLFAFLEFPYIKCLSDTAKFLIDEEVNQFDTYISPLYNTAFFEDKKLYIEESSFFYEYVYIDLDGMTRQRWKSNTRIIDMNSYERNNFNYAIHLIPWKNGHIVFDTSKQWSYVASNGERFQFRGVKDISFNKDFVLMTLFESDYVFDADHNLTEIKGYYGDMFSQLEYKSVGVQNLYFDGITRFETPKDFFLMAMNKAKLGLGYQITNLKGLLGRKYMYYNFQTKEFTPCEFNFSQSGVIQVADLDGYFIFMEKDLKTGKANIWQIEQDLKTVKSSFIDLKDFGVETVDNPLKRHLIFYTTDKKERNIFFDKDFQFILEADAKDCQITYPFWDRLTLKSPKKTIQMNLKGQFVNK
jgi:hypothetical protein